MCVVLLAVAFGLSYMFMDIEYKDIMNIFSQKDVSRNALSNDSVKQGLPLTNFTKYIHSHKVYVLHFIDKLNVTAKEKHWQKTNLHNGDANAKKMMQDLATESGDETFKKFNMEFQQRLPGGIIIGCKKCGTNFFVHVLRQHSGLAMRRDEVHYFNTHKNTSNQDYKAYRLQMMYSFVDQLTMEKTPRYWVRASVPNAIKMMNPHMKLILLVRDPACRMVSDYYHCVRMKNEINTTVSFSDIVTQPKYKQDYNTLINPSLYDVHMENWLRTFPLEQIMILKNEDLWTSKLPKILFEIEEHLGLNHEFNVIVSPSNMCINNVNHIGINTICFPTDEKGTCKYTTKHGTALQNIREVLQPHVTKFEEIVNRAFNWF